MAPYGPPSSMALEDAQSRLPGHLTYTPKRRQQPAGEGTDQSAAPTLLADEGAPQPPTHKRSPPCLFGGSHYCSPAAVNVVPGPQHAPGLRTYTQEEGGHRDRRTASTPAMAAAAAKNIAKKSASYAHANPRLKQDNRSSRTLASNPCPPLCPRRTIPSNKIDRGRGEHACLDGTGRRICLARTMIWLHPRRF